jgi:hypothetical protein
VGHFNETLLGHSWRAPKTRFQQHPRPIKNYSKISFKPTTGADFSPISEAKAG